uniref:Polycomb group protein RNA binding region domain-containing protein n=1 Tax=Periophthalmus magnuspinnatus TaxID=409849 RepID=A0A3B4AYT8_9GOBI
MHTQTNIVPGRKRGRPPIRKLDFESCYVETLTPIKIPKKRGRKPGFKLKPRMLLSPLANSPPNSTPEPEIGSLPQDAALVPHSATPQVLTVLSSFLKVGRSEQSRRGLGSEFQRVGAAMEKALSPQVRSLVLQGRDRRLELEERRERDGVWRCSRSVR